MAIRFGTAFYFSQDLRTKAEVVLEIFKELQVIEVAAPIFWHGMKIGTDKFSRLSKLSSKPEKEFLNAVGGGGYSDLLGFLGKQREPQASISLGIGEDVQEAKFTTLCKSPESVETAEKFSFRLWELLSPLYGFSLCADSDTALLEELSATPIGNWKVPVDKKKEERLLRIQRARGGLGRFVRGAAWGTFLGRDLVARLGGVERIRAEAPVASVTNPDDGGAYLRLTTTPAILGSSQYEAAAARLEEYLRPVMPEKLRS